MSELKATTVYDAYWKANSVGEGTGILVYLKSEADKVIAEKDKEIKEQKRLRDMALASVPNVLKVMKIIQHHKFKRCLAMAWWCESKVYHIRRTPLGDMDEHEYWQYENDFWQRWQKRWLELAEKVNGGCDEY